MWRMHSRQQGVSVIAGSKQEKLDMTNQGSKKVVLLIHAFFDADRQEEELLRTERERVICEKLTRRGIDAEHIMLWSGSFPLQLKYNTTLFQVDGSARPGNFFSTKLAAYVCKREPDVVIFKGMGFALPYKLFVSCRLNCRIGFIVGGGDKDVLDVLSSIVFAESPKQREIYHIRGIPSEVLPKYVERISVLNAPNTKDFDIVVVGQLIARKNIQSLINIDQKYSIVIVGDGELRDELEDLFSNFNNIKFIGAVDPSDVVQHLDRSKILVHPSLSEGVPRVVVEAMARGLPVIGKHEVLDGVISNGVDGFLYDTEDDMNAHVSSLLEDPVLLNKFSNSALGSSLKFSNEVDIDRCVNSIFNLAFQSKRTAPTVTVQIVYVWFRILKFESRRIFRGIVRRLSLF